MLLLEKVCCLNLAAASMLLGWFGVCKSWMLIILELIAIHFLIQYNGVLIGLSLDILLNLLGFIACICLIQGVTRENKNMMLAWLLLTLVSAVLLSLGLGIGGLVLIVYELFFVGVAMILFDLFVIAYMMYCWFTVYSFYHVLRRREVLGAEVDQNVITSAFVFEGP